MFKCKCVELQHHQQVIKVDLDGGQFAPLALVNTTLANEQPWHVMAKPSD